MKWASIVMVLTSLAACGVDGPPVRPSINSTVGVGSGKANAAIGTDWISGRVSTHVGVAF